MTRLINLNLRIIDFDHHGYLRVQLHIKRRNGDATSNTRANSRMN